MSVDPRLVERLCELAALDLDEAGARRLAAKLERVVAYVDRLASLDLPEMPAPAAAPAPLPIAPTHRNPTDL